VTFEPEIVEVQLALNRIGTTDMPKLAQDALEAGFDGPATRRLAALSFPTIFEVRAVLPRAMQEWQIDTISSVSAALRLAKHRARDILASGDDPLKHIRDFEQMWRESDYSLEITQLGTLDEDVYVARTCGQTEDEIRAWVVEQLKALADR
jgi:hypothetical protein